MQCIKRCRIVFTKAPIFQAELSSGSPATPAPLKNALRSNFVALQMRPHNYSQNQKKILIELKSKLIDAELSTVIQRDRDLTPS